MSLALRPASAATDRQEMLELQDTNLLDRPEGRFEWRHFANPAGPAWSWFLYEEVKGSAVGMASVFPTCMFIDGKKVVCGQVGEFVVDAKYRSLGPALMLQRATFGPVDSGAIAVCYDTPPDDHGMSTFKRLGMQASTEVFRYALPLRSDEFLQKKLGDGSPAKIVTSAANLLLDVKFASRRKRTIEGLEISVFEGLFDDEFTQLDQSVSSSGMIRACRSADLLNWRYRKMPRRRYMTLAARRAGELVGFLTAINNAGRVGVGEMFGHQIDEIGAALLDALVSLCRKERARLLEGYSSEDCPARAAFLNVGFTRRERVARIVSYEKPEGCGKRMLTPATCWAFTAVETIL
jgi:GNAT superfamily N-acetyltransferase